MGQARLQRADFTGELHGERLARAYANMDLFVFPSETDTYGNVINEAMASGTPAIVTSKGGPNFRYNPELRASSPLMTRILSPK